MGDINYYIGDALKREPNAVRPVFTVCYGDMPKEQPAWHDTALHLTMSSPSYEANHTETWWAPSSTASSHGTLKNGALRFIDLGNELIIFGKLATLADLERETFASFDAIFKLLSKTGHNRLLRSWNFIPQINIVPSGGIENYQAFCAGRSRAFETNQVLDVEMPAATGIGTQSNQVLGYMIATKRRDFSHVENSLQTPAHKYPKKYGPRSPSFARATVLNKFDLTPPRQTVFFLSGTASIRASETIGTNDVEAQVDVLMENIHHLLKTTQEQGTYNYGPLTLDDFNHFKVYVRHASDIKTVEAALTKKWKIDFNRLHFMNVDICRSDLLVEIEGCVNSCDTTALLHKGPEGRTSPFPGQT